MASPSGDAERIRGLLRSVNIGEVRTLEYNGREITTGIFKVPTTEPQLIGGDRIGSDRQADTVAHGGPDKAVYAYAAEDYAWWAGELARPLDPGLFGENLMTSGIDISQSKVGDRWHIGEAVLEVSEPRVPCFKLSLAVGEPRFQQRFAVADRPGAYLRVLAEGHVQVGDVIDVEPTEGPSVTLAAINAIHHRAPERAGEMVDVPQLSDAWRSWARDALETHQ